jgi:transcriptional regulator with XRE-family HTH domain
LVMKLRGWNQREWARRAQLKEESNVNKLLKRLESHPDEFPGDARTLQKLADVAGVTMDWLALGRGAPLAADFVVADDPRYPSRAAVAVAGLLMGFPKDAVDAMLAIDLIGESADPGADYWLQTLLAERAKLASQHAPQLTK